jgi:hypothetical protein
MPLVEGFVLTQSLRYLRLQRTLVFTFLAFKQLRSMGFDELRNIYRVLGEKELRIHVDLEDNFDAVEEGEQGAMRGAQPLSLPMKLPNDMSTDED